MSAEETAPSTARTNAANRGDVIGRKFIVEKVLGEGSMGVVVSARHKDVGTRVAIKIGRTPDRDTSARFQRDARAMAKLESPHTVRVYDVGETHDGLPWMIMEFLEGRDLGQVLAEGGPIGIDDALRWMAQACDAIAEAHDLGILHRDLKPQNLFLERATPGTTVIRVLDFGLAPQIQRRLDEGETRLTKPGGIPGTSHFMAPEQVQAAKLDARTDVWAAGAVLYRLLTHQYPFGGINLAEVCRGILETPPAKLKTHKTLTEVPAGTEAVILRCLQKSPKDRFQTIRELGHAIRNAREELRSTPVVISIGKDQRSMLRDSESLTSSAPVTPIVPTNAEDLRLTPRGGMEIAPRSFHGFRGDGGGPPLTEKDPDPFDVDAASGIPSSEEIEETHVFAGTKPRTMPSKITTPLGGFKPTGGSSLPPPKLPPLRSDPPGALPPLAPPPRINPEAAVTLTAHTMVAKAPLAPTALAPLSDEAPSSREPFETTLTREPEPTNPDPADTASIRERQDSTLLRERAPTSHDGLDDVQETIVHRGSTALAAAKASPIGNATLAHGSRLDDLDDDDAAMTLDRPPPAKGRTPWDNLNRPSTLPLKRPSGRPAANNIPLPSQLGSSPPAPLKASLDVESSPATVPIPSPLESAPPLGELARDVRAPPARAIPTPAPVADPFRAPVPAPAPAPAPLPMIAPGIAPAIAPTHKPPAHFAPAATPSPIATLSPTKVSPAVSPAAQLPPAAASSRDELASLPRIVNPASSPSLETSLPDLDPANLDERIRATHEKSRAAPANKGPSVLLFVGVGTLAFVLGIGVWLFQRPSKTSGAASAPTAQATSSSSKLAPPTTGSSIAAGASSHPPAPAIASAAPVTAPSAEPSATVASVEPTTPAPTPPAPTAHHTTQPAPLPSPHPTNNGGTAPRPPKKPAPAPIDTSDPYAPWDTKRGGSTTGSSGSSGTPSSGGSDGNSILDKRK